MNRTYHKIVLRTIKSTLSRFLAIFAIVALGVGFLAGLLSSPDDMRISADAYYDDTDMHDIRIVSTLGLTDEDVEAVSRLEDVEALVPVRDTDLVLFTGDGDSFTSRVHTLPPEGGGPINTPVLLSGRMPEKPGECVAVRTKSLAAGRDWIGETLTPQQDEKSPDDGLPETLTVVGTVKSSLYLSMEQERTTAGTGTVNLILFTPLDTFDYDYYTGLYLTVKGAKELDSFGDGYRDKVDSLSELLEPLGEDRVSLRYQEIVDDANAELNDARQEYEDGKAEADEKLADARRELEDGEQMLADSQQELADAKTEIDNGWAELRQQRNDTNSRIAAAQAEIDRGYREIQTYQAQLDEGGKKLQEAREQLDAGYQQLEEGDQQLTAAKIQLEDTENNLAALDAGKAGLRQLAAGLGLPVSDDLTDAQALALIAQLEAVSPEAAAQFAPLKAGLEALAAQGTDSAQARAALEAGKAEYEKNLADAQAARTELDNSRQLLTEQTEALAGQQKELDSQKALLDRSAATLRETRAQAQRQFASAETELADGQRQYEDGLKELEKGKEELAQGRQEYENSKRQAEEELADAEEKLKDAEQEIRKLEKGQWYLFTREDNAGFSSYGSNADKIAAIATVFPLFFFLVAALVALTTMTRMVEEERQQIGTLKALGYSGGKIAAKYLFYAAAASVAGSIFGLAFGTRLFPYIIISAYNIMYDIPEALTPLNPANSLLASLAAILCTLAATWNACGAALREVPARLMLPKAPKAGKRIFLERVTPLWKRLKFTQKVTARNLFRYKKRLFMTVIGIAGCTALLVTGFGVRDSISHIVSNQYEDLNHYQLMVLLDEDRNPDNPTKEISDLLNNRTEGHYAVRMESGEVIPQGDDPQDEVNLLVYDDSETLQEFMTFRQRMGHEPVELSTGDSSAVISEKLAERQHLKAGDVISVKDGDGQEAQFTVSGICENYVGHYLYLPQAAYEHVFGREALPNAVLCRLPADVTPEEEDALSTELLKSKSVLATQFTDALSESFSNTISSLNSIVLVLIISAGALAFVVLYNLININIAEREKELATIKVLGFYDAEVDGYIYRETTILTLIGTAVGLVLGMFLHQFVIRTAEIDLVMFGRVVYPLSYVWSALLTLLFSVLVNLVMHRKLKKISMVESMKAPE